MQLLLEGCRQNNRESQRLLYQHYYSYAMSICLRYCRSSDGAKEILNDGFLKVFKKIDQYNPDTSFKAWLRRIMINTAIDYYRREAKHNYHEDIENTSLESNQPEVIGQLSYEELIHMIQRLPPAYRAVFNLHVVDGYSHEEIGLILNISEGTSKSNLMKARISLKKMLEKMNKSYARSV